MSAKDDAAKALADGAAHDAARMQAMADQAHALRGYARQAFPDEKARAAYRRQEEQRRATIEGAVAAGKIDEARALMTDEERQRFDARTKREAARAERTKPKRDTETITATDVGEMPADLLADEDVISESEPT